eukprot:scaffold4099_cov53-Attheya_sp.AAC.3
MDKAQLPPVARREEERVVWAGRVTTHVNEDSKNDDEDEDEGPPLRQAEDSTEELVDPPMAVPDPYGWLRDDKRVSEEVLEHLKLENDYTQSQTNHLSNVRETLYQDLLQRIQETDHSLPHALPEGGAHYLYYSRTMQGKAYRISCRAPKPDNDDATTHKWDGSKEMPILPGEVQYLDQNILASDKPYCSLGGTHVKVVSSSSSGSTPQTWVAYTADFSGDETYGLHVMDIESNQTLLTDETVQSDGSVLWGNFDPNTNTISLYYIQMDEMHRPYRVYRRTLVYTQGEDGSSSSSSLVASGPDELLFEELNDLCYTSIDISQDGKYLFVSVSSSETSEVYFLDMQTEGDDTPQQQQLQSVAPRRKKVLYDVEHRNGSWLITTNVNDSPNMRLMVSPAVPDSAAHWTLLKFGETPLFDGGLERALDEVVPFRHHIVASGREGGIPRIWIISLDENEQVKKSLERLDFEEEAYDVGLGPNELYDSSHVVVSYDSLVTPPQSIRVDMNDPTSPRTVLKETHVPGYVKEDYGCERITVKSRDGTTEIPVSIVYRKNVMEEFRASHKPMPVHLNGYGSYGCCEEADFGVTRLPLLERGMVYVIAHVRGGGEMGRTWYEAEGKYLHKQNTFHDFVDVARWLVEEKQWTTPDLLSCEGRSAGGLLIGASINQAPHLFRVAILGVPFVDVVATMIDSTIPLTSGEWEEWGNPNEKKYLDYMLQYSPINNVKPNATYPSCLLTGGLHDPRVQVRPLFFISQL